MTKRTNRGIQVIQIMLIMLISGLSSGSEKSSAFAQQAPPSNPKIGKATNEARSSASSSALREKWLAALRNSENGGKLKFNTMPVFVEQGGGVNLSIAVTFIRYQSQAFFDFDHSEPLPAAVPMLRALANNMVQDQSLRSIIVVAHTDSRGTVDYNYELARRRGLSVAALLLGFGIKSDLINVVAMGADQPADDNSSERGRANNRRVEFYLSDAPAAAIKAVEERKYNPCHARTDCVATARSIPFLSPDGNATSINLTLSRSALPRNNSTGYTRAPLPLPPLKRRPLTDWLSGDLPRK